MLSWPEEFISKLTTRHFVIRYDIRDTGRSTSYPIPQDGKGNYTMTDLCNDALAILDYLKIESANFVGFSMGGVISWVIAATHLPRVKSLTLISTSPVGPAPSSKDDLPPLNPDLLKQIATAPMPTDWHEKDQVVRFLMYFDATMAYKPLTEQEKEESKALAEKVFQRAEMENSSVQSFFGQSAVAQKRWPRELLKDIKCPTTIIHGREDRNIGLSHAKVLNEEIKGSKLVVVDELAHEMPRRVWDDYSKEILAICK